MNSRIFLFLATIFSGFALIRIPLADTFLASIEPVTTIIGVLAILLFSLVLIYYGVRNLFSK
ncbi:hypothetical protein AB3Z07_10950 [Metabacillus halosaccharovorans]|uniref:hypothetical protein n=1 Tax=Metabacillus halosaccharovorans TaxID=930124 RepID=UPI0034CE33DF